MSLVSAFACLGAVIAILFVIQNNRKLDRIYDECKGIYDECKGIYDECKVSGALNRQGSAPRALYMFFAYHVVLSFPEGEIVSKNLLMLDSIGYEDRIEILKEQDGQPGLTVECGNGSEVLHTMDDLPRVFLDAESSFSLFRDRLVSEGWKIEWPVAESGGSSDEAISGQAESVGQGS